MTAGDTHKLPHDPALVALLATARRVPETEVLIHDVVGFDKTYPELLADVLKTRDALRARLPLAALDERGLLHRDHGFVPVLSRSGYEFVVSFFAIRALGGVVMPLGE